MATGLDPSTLEGILERDSRGFATILDITRARADKVKEVRAAKPKPRGRRRGR